MLPPTSASRPACWHIRPMSVVVVDFPLVPVTAITRPRSQREASSSSPITGTPAERAARTSGCSRETPGLTTIRSAPSSVSTRCFPSSTPMPSRTSVARLVQVVSLVGERHTRAAASQEPCGRHAAAAAADDHHVLPRDRKLAHGLLVRLAEPGRHSVNAHPSVMRSHLVHPAHRSFSVVRLKSPKMIPTMTKRLMIFGSLHPTSSK